MDMRSKASYCSADSKAELFWSGGCDGEPGKPTTPEYLITYFDCIPVQLILAVALAEGVAELNIIGCVYKDLPLSWRGLYKTRTLTDQHEKAKETCGPTCWLAFGQANQSKKFHVT
jgi:hypothetical protein